VPAALQRWVFFQTAPSRPAPSSVTITQALELAQTPLYELSTVLTTTATSTITSTSHISLTNTVQPTPPFLNSIIAGSPQDAPGARGHFNDGESVFEQALRDGYAIRFSYTLTAADGSTQTVNLYQWSAQQLGAYLRASAQWQSSGDSTFDIAGRQVTGWRVIDRRDGSDWLLFELDGTLIAAGPPTSELVNVLAQIKKVTR